MLYYIDMRNDYEKAKNLRRSGMSYKEINNLLDIPVSTISEWFSAFEWSKEIKNENILKNNKMASVNMKKIQKNRNVILLDKYQTAKKQAAIEFEQYKNNRLFILGLALYWGEGDKRSLYHTRITNSDPHIIRIFLLFSKKFLSEYDIKRIKANVFIYNDIIDQEAKNFWSESIDLPLNQFTKSTLLVGKSKNRLTYGTCTLIIGSRYLKVKMLQWLELLEKEF